MKTVRRVTVWLLLVCGVNLLLYFALTARGLNAVLSAVRPLCVLEGELTLPEDELSRDTFFLFTLPEDSPENPAFFTAMVTALVRDAGVNRIALEITPADAKLLNGWLESEDGLPDLPDRLKDGGFAGALEAVRELNARQSARKKIGFVGIASGVGDSRTEEMLEAVVSPLKDRTGAEILGAEDDPDRWPSVYAALLEDDVPFRSLLGASYRLFRRLAESASRGDLPSDRAARLLGDYDDSVGTRYAVFGTAGGLADALTEKRPELGGRVCAVTPLNAGRNFPDDGGGEIVMLDNRFYRWAERWRALVDRISGGDGVSYRDIDDGDTLFVYPNRP